MTTLANGVDEMKSLKENVITTNREDNASSPEINGVNGNGDEGLSPWLDKEFVETIMRRDAANCQLCVDHIDVHTAVPKGDNYASLLLRVNVDYRDNKNDLEAKQLSLIVKSFPHGELMQKWLEETKVFQREALIYETTLPAIYKMVEERTGHESAPLATKVFFNDRPNTIVLEDLKPLGYKMADRRQGLDLQHSIKALRTLAKLHALSIPFHAGDPTTMDLYPEKMYAEGMRQMQTDFMVPIFTNLATEVGKWAGFEKYEEKVKVVAQTAVGKVIEMVRHKPGGIRVLNHGDFWTNNMLFHYDSEGNIDDVKVLDFQMVRFASPALDIIYFLNTSPSQQVLEDHYDEMLEEYHASLSETMRSINCEEDTIFSLDTLKSEMADKAFFAVVISGMFCIMVAEPEDAPDFSDITEEDVKKGDVHQMDKAFTGKRFRYALQRRLPRFEAQGLI